MGNELETAADAVSQFGGRKFEPVPAVEGTGLADVIAGRGMAVGDLFNDGKIDAVINVMDGHPVLLRNVSDDQNHWLELKLVGGAERVRAMRWEQRSM